MISAAVNSHILTYSTHQTLIESCNKVISDSNVGSPVSQARVNEGGSSENTDPPTPDAVGSEKVQRARVLLHALTKNHKS